MNDAIIQFKFDLYHKKFGSSNRNNISYLIKNYVNNILLNLMSELEEL